MASGSQDKVTLIGAAAIVFIVFGGAIFAGLGDVFDGDSGSDQPREQPAARQLSAAECDRLDEDWESARFAADTFDEIVQSQNSKGRRAGDALEGQSRAVDEMTDLLDRMEAGGCL